MNATVFGRMAPQRRWMRQPDAARRASDSGGRRRELETNGSEHWITGADRRLSIPVSESLDF
jgi:hypothetical protein